MKSNAKQKKSRDIYDLYRKVLKAPTLSRQEIEVMRLRVQELARTICEHVWGKKLF